MKGSKLSVIVFWILIIVTVVVLSNISVKFLGTEKLEDLEIETLNISPEMTVRSFGEMNHIPNPVLKKVFKLDSPQELSNKVSQYEISEENLKYEINKLLALTAEEASKDWKKILIKFILWIIFIGIVFSLIRKKRLAGKTRNIVYVLSVLIFGVILGSDPSAMGTVKDAIVLFASKGAVFPPRMIALTVFLSTVIIFNKSICAWGCQFGTLQDLFFRINRGQENHPVFRQYKIPFKVSNSIRIIFFISFTALAFTFTLDLVDYIDPFKIFKPAVLIWVGWVFILLILFISLFIYRPWCSLFCPFGLVGWLFEKISIFKISVDYSKCIACDKCTEACPSDVMKTILKRRSTISDCFSCGSCQEVCPVDAIKFRTGKREFPPEGKFPDQSN